MRIISLTSAAVAIAAVLSVGAVVQAPHAAHGAVAVGAAPAAFPSASPSGATASGDGNDPWD